MSLDLLSRPRSLVAGLRDTALWRTLRPPQLFVGSFLLLILLGTVGFRLLPGLYTGEELSWLDALFTATSAVCVTGLIVVDTATFFTTAGQAYILLLIQLGGLGLFTFTTLIILALGQRLSLRSETLVSNTAGVAPEIDYRRLTRHILVFTFAFEALGAVLLFLFMGPRLGWSEALWPALFHSISAFCNAGFSTFSDSLTAFQGAPLLLGTVMALIVLGGIGFLTIEELVLWRKARSRAEPNRFSLSLHSRLVLVSTVLLLIGGWVLFTLFEWNVTLAEMPLSARLLNSLFLSVTARTAGFNTIDYASATESTNFLTILLMAVGGSPGSTAGGLKTTTFALIGLLAWTRLRGYERIHLWGRTVPEETIQRAVGLFVLAFGLMTASIFLYTNTEIGYIAYGLVEEGFLAYMFEAVSAFNTVGLSMGVTADLSVPGRCVTILLMFIGRVGPLSLAAALARRRVAAAQRFRYAYEDVIIG